MNFQRILKNIIYKIINDFKHDTNKQLNDLKKTMQDMKEEFNKKRF